MIRYTKDFKNAVVNLENWGEMRKINDALFFVAKCCCYYAYAHRTEILWKEREIIFYFDEPLTDLQKKGFEHCINYYKADFEFIRENNLTIDNGALLFMQIRTGNECKYFSSGDICMYEGTDDINYKGWLNNYNSVKNNLI